MTSPTPATPRNFFASLYDLSFRKFVTPTIIQILYIITLIVIAIWSIGFLVMGFMPHPDMMGYGYGGPSIFTIVFHIVGAAVIFVVGSIAARVYLEFIVAVFRIAENTESLRTKE